MLLSDLARLEEAITFSLVIRHESKIPTETGFNQLICREHQTPSSWDPRVFFRFTIKKNCCWSGTNPPWIKINIDVMNTPGAGANWFIADLIYRSRWKRVKPCWNLWGQSWRGCQFSCWFRNKQLDFWATIWGAYGWLLKIQLFLEIHNFHQMTFGINC